VDDAGPDSKLDDEIRDSIFIKDFMCNEAYGSGRNLNVVTPLVFLTAVQPEKRHTLTSYDAIRGSKCIQHASAPDRQGLGRSTPRTDWRGYSGNLDRASFIACSQAASMVG